MQCVHAILNDIINSKQIILINITSHETASICFQEINNLQDPLILSNRYVGNFTNLLPIDTQRTVNSFVCRIINNIY